MDAAQVKVAMNNRAEEVCRYLIPSGRRDRDEWVTGDVNGAKGESFRVHLEGAKTGVFADFAADQKGGSLLDLWMLVRNCDFKSALREAKDFLGIKDDGWRRATASGTPPPRPQAKLEDHFKPAREGGAVWRWLVYERKIAPETIKAYRIGEARFALRDMEQTEYDFVVFPSYTPDGKLARLKYRAIQDKKKMFVKPRKADGGFDLLFGWQAVGPMQSDLFVTEGEIDAMTFHSFGLPAVSLPMGAQPTKAAVEGEEAKSPHDDWIERDFDRLQEFVAVTLALDADKPGQDATRVLVPRLGRMRCNVVQWPEGIKDANDARKAGMRDADFSTMIAQAKSCDPDELKLPSAFKAALLELWNPSDPKKAGVEMPWPIPFKVRPGEVTIWQGYTKHGKTTALSHCLTHWGALHNHRSLIASFEIPGECTIENILRQATCQRMYRTESELDARLRWMDQRFLIYDYVGDAKSIDVLEIFEYAARKYGVQHIVLDSLMKIQDVDGDDYTGQRVLLNRLCTFAVEFGCHIHLVAHSKKPDAKHPPEKNWPGIYDIMGSSYLPNLAHNIVCVWRNVLKSQTIQALELEIYRANAKANPDTGLINVLEDQLEAERAKNDSLFIVQGQRKTGETPMKNLWFDHGLEGSWQFRDDPAARPRAYLEALQEQLL